MPRNQQTRSRGDDKLNQLAAVAQLYGAFSGQDERQQRLQQEEHQGRVAAAMQLLGLQQQQAQAGQMDAFRQQQLQQEGQQFQQTHQEQQGQQQALLDHQKQMEAIAAKEQADASGYRWNVQAPAVYGEEAARNATLQHQQSLEDLQRQTLQQDTFKTMMSVPGANIEQAMQFLPSAQQPIVAAQHQEAIQKELGAKGALLESTPPEMRKTLLQTITMNQAMHPTVRKLLLEKYEQKVQSQAQPTSAHSGNHYQGALDNPSPGDANFIGPLTLAQQPFSIWNFIHPDEATMNERIAKRDERRKQLIAEGRDPYWTP